MQVFLSLYFSILITACTPPISPLPHLRGGTRNYVLPLVGTYRYTPTWKVTLTFFFSSPHRDTAPSSGVRSTSERRGTAPVPNSTTSACVRPAQAAVAVLRRIGQGATMELMDATSSWWLGRSARRAGWAGRGAPQMNKYKSRAVAWDWRSACAPRSLGQLSRVVLGLLLFRPRFHPAP